jgi:hypothetical protein
LFTLPPFAGAVTHTVIGADAIPLATTARSLFPASAVAGTSKNVWLDFMLATAMLLWSCVRAYTTWPLFRLVMRTSG